MNAHRARTRSPGWLAAALAIAPAALAQTSFRNDIVPILTKSGCNSGSCHGAAAGKNGFLLSLFGYDPARDHTALTRALRGRRLDPAHPDDSLMLQKATARVRHQGGKRLDPDGVFYARIRDWIEQGAAADPATTPQLLGIHLEPEHAELNGATQPLQFAVHARYADGGDREVSALTIWSSSNDAALAVDGTGRAASHDPGAAYVLARYGGFVAVAQVQVHADAAPFPFPDVVEHNFVDEWVDAKLRRAHVVPAPVCSDEVFVRRVHLDLLDALPTAATTRAFLDDQRPDKRARLVDELLERPEFADVQAMDWADVLQVDAATMEPKGAALLTASLRSSFRAHRPFDQVVRELLTAAGPTFRVPAANFYVAAPTPQLAGEHVAQVFLGIRLQCAQCHNHPFENWSMDDYYGFAAFFGQLGQKRGEDPTEWILFDRQNGDVRHKRDGTVSAPRLLGGVAPQIDSGTDRRAVLAQWLTAADNPYFARHVANRAVARLFGRGIVDPPDDVRTSNPPSHPELLARLAQELAAASFDVRALYRTLCASRTYQQARHPGTPAPSLFAGNQVRRLSAEQLLAAIDAATDVPTRLPGLPAGSPIAALASGKTDLRFLELFGRPARTSSCTCERSAEPTLGQTLHLVNGDTIAQKLAAPNGRLARALQQHQPAAAMLDELFLAAYCRLPRADERTRLLADLPDGDEPARTAAWQDRYWAVLNSQEFLFQH